ncbi:hypothetical protein [Mesorhizobium sp. M0590]|uniref:hypothetical protein n=1 Tax=Mesorhizobium sp. M0590 TaxID=2956966 RepID=UPI0033362E6D
MNGTQNDKTRNPGEFTAPAHAGTHPGPLRYDHHRQSGEDGTRDPQPDMTGFVVKNSCVASQEFNRKAEEVGQRRCSDGAAAAIAMAFRYHLSDRNGKKLKQALRRTMMTSLAVVQRSHNVHLLVPQPEYMSSRPWPRFSGDAKRVMRVQDLTVAENMSRPIQPAILGTPKAFKM